MTDNREPYNLNRSAHHITNDVLRRIESICHESGVEIAFGVRVHNAVNTLVEQYQALLADNDNTAPSGSAKDILQAVAPHGLKALEKLAQSAGVTPDELSRFMGWSDNSELGDD